MNKFYELFSLAFGLAAIGVILFYLITHPNCLIFFEPVLWIRVLEVSTLIIILPYYLIKFKELGKRW